MVELLPYKYTHKAIIRDLIWFMWVVIRIIRVAVYTGTATFPGGNDG